MEPYAFVAGFGLLVLLTAWLPLALERLPLSLPILCVAIGAGLAAIPAIGSHVPNPESHLLLLQETSGLVVLLSLIAAGLKIDRPFGLRRWLMAWRMLGIAMPITITMVAALAVVWLGLELPEALLLGASLAPTDPVLAADVQVGAPSEGDSDEVRFTLTTEASLNDGMAFPFVSLAILAAAAGGLKGIDFGHWLAVDVVWKTLSGALLGAAIGAALGWVTFHMPQRAKILAKTDDGFVALGVTFLAFGLVELIHGYGFIGVFAAALALRGSCPDAVYHARMYKFAEEIERILMMVVLVGFGAALTHGGLLAGLRWPVIGFAAVTLLVIRPLSGWIGTIGNKRPGLERLIIAFFGIRGLATIYYLAYAFQRAEFAHRELLWSAVSLVVLLSIVVHGALSTPSLAAFDRRRAA